MLKTKKYSKVYLNDLSKKVIKKYKIRNEGYAIVLNSNPDNYDDLANDINAFIDDQLIRPEWIRSLYYSHIRKDNVRLNSTLVGALQTYVGEDKSSNTDNTLTKLTGKYKFIYRGTYLENDISNDYRFYIIEFTDEDVVLTITGKNKKYVLVSRQFLRGIEYFYLRGVENAKCMFLEIQRGYTTRLNYLSCIYMSTDPNSLPSSGPVLLIKDELDLNIELVKYYFSKYSLSNVKAVSIGEMIHIETDYKKHLKSSRDSTTRMDGLKGEWLIILKPTKDVFEKSILTIDGNNVSYESRNNFYNSGSYSIVGDKNLVINLENPGRYACVIANIGHLRKTENITYMQCTFTGTGSSKNLHGVGLMIRIDDIGYKLEELHTLNKEIILEMGIEKPYLDSIESHYILLNTNMNDSI